MWQKLILWKIQRTDTVTTLKTSNGDKTQKLKVWQLKNQNCDQTQNQIVTKLKNSNGEKAQKVKLYSSDSSNNEIF